MALNPHSPRAPRRVCGYDPLGTGRRVTARPDRRFTAGRHGFEYVLSAARCSSEEPVARAPPDARQDRTARAPAFGLAELQRQLDEFREHYNEHRPHHAPDRTTPAAADRA